MEAGHGDGFHRIRDQLLLEPEGERVSRRDYLTREEAKADVFDQRHSTLKYLSPAELEGAAGSVQERVGKSGESLLRVSRQPGFPAASRVEAMGCHR